MRHDDAIAEGAYCANLATLTFYSEFPATVSDGDAYLYEDYIYQYNPDLNGWTVQLATEDTGILNIVPNYPVTDKTKTSYSPILMSINNKSVVHLYKTFWNCSNLTNITIPNSIVVIGNCAFAVCENLTNINIPNSVTTIDREAFCQCKNLTNVNIPNGVTSIGIHAFS